MGNVPRLAVSACYRDWQSPLVTVLDDDVGLGAGAEPLPPAAGHRPAPPVHQLQGAVLQLGGRHREVEVAIEVQHTDGTRRYTTRSCLISHSLVILAVFSQLQHNFVLSYVFSRTFQDLQAFWRSCVDVFLSPGGTIYTVY